MTLPAAAEARKEAWAAAFLVLSTFALHLGALGWAVPTWRRSLLVFESKERIQALAPELLRSREQVYAQYRHIDIDSARGGLAPGSRVPEQSVLEGMRPHLLQPRTPDESLILGALSRLKQSLRTRRFPLMVYGYAFLEALGLSLGLAHLLGVLTLTSDISFYLVHPEQVARICMAGRLLSAACDILTAGIVYGVGRRLFGWRTACMAALLFSWNPVSVIISHLIKPWSSTALSAAAQLCFVLRIAEGSEREADFWGAGIAGGLAAGTSYPYALNWLWIPLARAFAKGPKLPPRDLRRLGLCALLSAAVFMGTNPQSVAYFSDMVRVARYQGLGNAAAVRSWRLPPLTETLLTLPGVFYLPALLAAARRALEPGAKAERFLWAAFAPWAMAYGFVFGGGAYRLLPLYPVLCLLAARGLAFGRGWRRWRVPSAVILTLALASSLLCSLSWLRDARMDNPERAGEWIKEHVPAGSSIALTISRFSTHTVPFPYLRYRLFSFPPEERGLVPDTDYVVDSRQPGDEPCCPWETLARDYRLLFILSPHRLSYQALPVPMPYFCPNGTVDIRIWGRRGP